LQADCQELGSPPEPYARQSSMGYLFDSTNEHTKHVNVINTVFIFLCLFSVCVCVYVCTVLYCSLLLPLWRNKNIINKIRRRTKSTPRSGWSRSHMIRLKSSDCSTREIMVSSQLTVYPYYSPLHWLQSLLEYLENCKIYKSVPRNYRNKCPRCTFPRNLVPITAGLPRCMSPLRGVSVVTADYCVSTDCPQSTVGFLRLKCMASGIDL